MHFLKLIYKSRSGFTLVELLIATFLFSIIAFMTISIFSQFLIKQRQINLNRVLQEDSLFMTEKIAKEFRNGTLDYPYYYLNNPNNPSASYANYLVLNPDPTSVPAIGTKTNLAKGSNYKLTSGTLAILASDMKTRTLIYLDAPTHQLMLAKQTVVCADPTSCILNPATASLTPTPISPSTMKVQRFDLYIYPAKDPNYFYADPYVQSQPYVTLLLETASSSTIENLTTIKIQTSLTSRVYNRPILYSTN